MTSLRKCVPYVLLGWYFLVFAYGIFSFPDAPYKPCGLGQYCGKRNAIHTESEYHSFRVWEATFLASLAVALVGGVILNDRKKRKSDDGNV